MTVIGSYPHVPIRLDPSEGPKYTRDGHALGQAMATNGLRLPDSDGTLVPLGLLGSVPVLLRQSEAAPFWFSGQ